MPSFDVVIIGAGPGGYVCAIRCAQLGLKVACIERSPTLGGTCLNVGCIPSKALLESSELYHRAGGEFAKHGIVVKPTLDLPTLLARKDKIVHTLTRGVDGLFKKNGVERFEGRGHFKNSREIEVLDSNGRVSHVLEASSVVVATGSSVATLRNLPMDGKHIFGSTEALSLAEPPNHLIIIGAGIIGLEMGSVWSRLGSKVTVLEFMDSVLPGADLDIRKQAQRSFRKQGLRFKLGVKVQSATVSEAGTVAVSYHDKKGEQSIEGDAVLVAVGRRPNTAGLGVENAGITLDGRGRIEVDDEFATSAPNIYAIGDVVRGPMLAHKAEDEGVAMAEKLAGLPGHVNYSVIPSVVYTNPEIAWVGQTEDQLKEQGVKYTRGWFPFAANGRAKALENTDGFVKLLADARTDRILGVHIIGPVAGELIGEMALAMEFGASSEDIARTCHAHPTLSEVVREAALDAGGRVLHI
ncbi:MAG: dihydrolipoyl dehydrogenase [Deltaproteobacteria bacterium]|nr:dihydrolipoyl dehydrogenase [Deltaproteobacteria bacterium]